MHKEIIMTTVVRSNLCDQVSQFLLEEIVAGTFPKSQPMPTESDLSERFGVSRSAIRESMKMLAARGMVKMRQGAGTFITDSENWKVVDPALLRALGKGKMLSELVEARLEIEPMFARIAATHATAEELQVIELSALNEQQLDDEEEAVRCDRAFHRGITESTHNFVFVVMMDSLNVLMEESRHLLVAAGKSEVRRSVEDHRRICRALMARDGEAAEREMRAHLMHVMKQVEMLTGAQENSKKKARGSK